MAVDGSGNVYIADTYGGQVLKETYSGGSYAQSTVTTGLNYPYGVAVDGSGNVYIADTHSGQVLKETYSGGSYTQSTVATGLNRPEGVAVDGSGNVYIANTYSGQVLKETYAGGGNYVQSTVATGLNRPEGVAVDGSGNVYIADTGYGSVLQLQPGGENYGAVNVGAQSATDTFIFQFNAAVTLSSTSPVQVLTQGVTGLDYRDVGGSCRSYVAFSSGDTCTVNVALTPKYPGVRNGAVVLYDSGNNPLATGYATGTGVGPQASFLPAMQSTAIGGGLSYPAQIATDGAGNLYIANAGTSQIIKETLSGGTYTSSVAVTALNTAYGVAVDGAGNLYVADTYDSLILKETYANGAYTPTVVTTNAGYPLAVAVDGAGNLYVADMGNNRILKETYSNDSYTESVLITGLNSPRGVAIDGSGNLYISNTIGSQVLKETYANGSYTQSVIGSGFSYPYGIVVDAAGDLYIADYGNGNITKETYSGGTYTQSTVATGLRSPWGLAADPAGNLFYGDYNLNVVDKFDIADGPTLPFGTVNDGSSSAAQSFQLTNIGNAALTAVSPGLSVAATFTQVAGGGTPADCSDTFSLAPADSCNVSIEFSPVLPADGSVSGTVTLTDNHLNATPSATQTVNLSGTAVGAGPATHFSITIPNPMQSYVATGFTVTALDANNNVATSFNGTVQLSSSDPGVVFIVNPITLTNGIYSYNFGLKTAGTQTVTATDTSDPAITGTASTVVLPGPATHLVVTAPANATAGTPFNFTVTANDLYGNVATGYAGTVSFQSTDGSAVLQANTTLTAGTGSFAMTLKTPGVQSISAADTITPSISGSSANITVATPNLVVTTASDDAGSVANCTAQSSTTTGTDAACSLRDAVEYANNAGTASITFDTTKFATQQVIALTYGPIEVVKNVTITGPGANLLQVSGATGSRVFQVDSGANMAIASLSIIAGYSGSNNGGGILNNGNLTLTGMTFSNNTTNGGAGGAIYSGGTLTVQNSTFSGNSAQGNPAYSDGGAIYTSANSLTISGSTFQGNLAARYGGAIADDQSTLTVTNSTFVGNQAAGPNGGGGAVLIDNTTAVLRANTYSGNMAGGGSRGGGAVLNEGTAELTNSIFSGNLAATGNGAAIYSQTGGGANTTADSNVYWGNIDSSNTEDDCYTCASNTNATSSDPNLATLGLYGGPTQTMLPLPKSAAICAGAVQNDSGLTTDQRGEPRSTSYSGTACVDAGAVQTNYSIAFQQQPTDIVAGSAITPAPAVQVNESGSPLAYTGVPVSVAASTGTLGGASSTTTGSTGLATYSTLSLPVPETNDSLTATLQLSDTKSVTATSSSFDVTQTTVALAAAASPSASYIYGTTPPAVTVTLTPSNATGITAADFTAMLDTTTALTVTAGANNTFQIAVPTGLAVGAHTINVSFDGGSAYTTSSTSVGLTVTQASTTTTLTSSGTSANLHSTIQFTGMTASATTGTPTGSMNFYDGTTLLGTASLNAGGTASFNTNTLTSGTHTITAVYGGDANYAGSTSTALIETVTSPDYSITSNPGSLSIKRGQSAVTNLTITPVGGFTGSIGLSCSGLPDYAQCIFSPATVAADGSNTVLNAKLTIATLGPGTGTVAENQSGTLKVLPAALFWLPGGVLMGFLAFERKKLRVKLHRALLVLLAVVALAGALGGLTGCGATDCCGVPGAPAGAYQVQVLASAAQGASNGAEQKQSVFTLTITQ